MDEESGRREIAAGRGFFVFCLISFHWLSKSPGKYSSITITFWLFISICAEMSKGKPARFALVLFKRQICLMTAIMNDDDSFACCLITIITTTATISRRERKNIYTLGC